MNIPYTWILRVGDIELLVQTPKQKNQSCDVMKEVSYLKKTNVKLTKKKTHLTKSHFYYCLFSGGEGGWHWKGSALRFPVRWSWKNSAVKKYSARWFSPRAEWTTWPWDNGLLGVNKNSTKKIKKCHPVLGCPWKWSQLVRKLIWNLLMGRIRATYLAGPW